MFATRVIGAMRWFPRFVRNDGRSAGAPPPAMTRPMGVTDTAVNWFAASSTWGTPTSGSPDDRGFLIEERVPLLCGVPESAVSCFHAMSFLLNGLNARSMDGTSHTRPRAWRSEGLAVVWRWRRVDWRSGRARMQVPR